MAKNPVYRLKRKIIRTLYDEQWSIVVCDLSGTVLKHIVPPKDRFWADPFPVEQDGKIFIFIEQQIGSGNGTLGFIELYPDLTYSNFNSILEKPYHLSFPNVFCIENNNNPTWYMIPETHEHRTIDLYRAASFPSGWEYETTLLSNVTAVDSVVFFYNSLWWLFTSIDSGKGSLNKNFSIFYSATFPSHNWIPHSSNPVSIDISNSRMAGAVSLNNETKLLNRPAQNCKKDYGKETNINEILELTPHSYKERCVRTIKPEKELSAVCTHTFNFTHQYIVRDIKTRKIKTERK
jgi:hypothetical protein